MEPYWLINANDGDTINCNSIAGQSITLTSSLPAITKSYTINGAGITINGVYFGGGDGEQVAVTSLLEEAMELQTPVVWEAVAAAPGWAARRYFYSRWRYLTIVNAQQISGNSAIAGLRGASTNISDPGYVVADGVAIGNDIFKRSQPLLREITRVGQAVAEDYKKLEPVL